MKNLIWNRKIAYTENRSEASVGDWNLSKNDLRLQNESESKVCMAYFGKGIDLISPKPYVYVCETK